MKILLAGDYPDDPRLGSSKVYFKLGEELRRLGHECDVVLGPELGARPSDPRLRMAAAPWLMERRVRALFRERGPYDVVDVASAEGFSIGLRRAAGGYPGTALVSRSHGLEHLNYRRMLDDARAGLSSKPWTRRIWFPAVRLTQVAGAARLADSLLVLNPVDRDFALRRRWKPADRVEMVPHGVSARFADDAPPAGAPRGAGILFCGSWDLMKGTAYLVRAAVLLARRGVQAPLTVLGPGLPEATVRAAFPEALQGRLTVITRAPEEEVMRQYRRHDLLVLPSSYEGFGMVVVEAMSQRLPVVATRVGAALTVIRDGESGLLVPPRDPEALAGAVARVLADGALRRRMGEAGAAAVSGMTWAATAAATAGVYRRALRRVRGEEPDPRPGA
jgi:glycosyltransferase involved in cell wall biosynthesis